MSNFFKRTITGILFVVLIVSSIIVSRYLFAAVFLAATVIGLYEFFSLNKSENISALKLVGIIVGSVVYILLALSANDLINEKFLFLNIPFLLILFIIELFEKNDDHLLKISYVITGIIYIAVPFGILNYYYQSEFLKEGDLYIILLGFFVLVWIHDVFAYLVGSTIGRHKLFPRISPRKTWEGSFGGLAFTILCAYFLHDLLGGLLKKEWIIMAVIIVLFGTFGDLVESMIKRVSNVKDSGTLLPGHGGVLDRFDAVLFASPAVYFYLLLIS